MAYVISFISFIKRILLKNMGMKSTILSRLFKIDINRTIVERDERRNYEEEVELNKVLLATKLFDSRDVSDNYREEIEYLKAIGKIQNFPYEFCEKYQKIQIRTFYDMHKRLFYVLHEGKRLYFSFRYNNINAVKSAYRQLLMEADPQSPHLYTTGDVVVNQNDVLLDVGAAEGIFTLSNIEKVKEAYIFEGDRDWLNALKATFEPYNNVTIIDKYVSNQKSESMVKLDDFQQKDAEYFVKIDVEGMEQEVLQGADNMLANHNCKVACCTYHKQTEYDEIIRFFEKFNGKYRITSSEGYMLFFHGEQYAPFFRKGLIRATNN